MKNSKCLAINREVMHLNSKKLSSQFSFFYVYLQKVRFSVGKILQAITWNQRVKKIKKAIEAGDNKLPVLSFFEERNFCCFEVV